MRNSVEVERLEADEVFRMLPASLRKWAVLERFHLHKAQQFQQQDAEFDHRYLPQNCGALLLPCFWIRRKHLYVFEHKTGSDREHNVVEGVDPYDRVLFPIHPASLSWYRNFLAQVEAEDATVEGTRIWAVPTSSARTFIAWPENQPERALCLKTTLHTVRFGDRRLYRRKVGCSVGLSRLVQDSLQTLPHTLGYFTESMGFVPRRLTDSGVIVRSIPKQIKEEGVVPAPLFSLIGEDSGRQPLLLTIFERTGMRPAELVKNVLCEQFARLWLELTMRFGLILEAHAQDLMLELSADFRASGRFLYRDFEGLQVDWELRRSRGISSPHDLPEASSWHDTYATWGYPQGCMVSYKYKISLYGYLHFVLNEIDLSLRAWRRRSLIGNCDLPHEELTMIFSRSIMRAVEEMFGLPARPGDDFNIYHSLNRFIILLMKHRRQLVMPRAGRVPMFGS